MTQTAPETPRYRVQVEKTATGCFLLRIPELHLIEENESLEKGWQYISEAKDRILERHAKIGALSDLPQSESNTPPQSTLRPYVLKTAIMTLALVIVVGAASVSFSFAVRESMQKVGLKIGRAAIHNIENGLKDFIQDEISPEKEAHIRELIAQAVPKLEPYAAELRPLFKD